MKTASATQPKNSRSQKRDRQLEKRFRDRKKVEMVDVARPRPGSATPATGGGANEGWLIHR